MSYSMSRELNTFAKFISIFSGMHMLMSFVGYIGTLMTNSGLEEIMKAAFGDVTRMFSDISHKM